MFYIAERKRDRSMGPTGQVFSAQALAHRLLGRGPQDQRIGSEDWYSFAFETTPVGRVISTPVAALVRNAMLRCRDSR